MTDEIKLDRWFLQKGQRHYDLRECFGMELGVVNAGDKPAERYELKLLFRASGEMYISVKDEEEANRVIAHWREVLG